MRYSSKYWSGWGRQATKPRQTSPFYGGWGRQDVETPGYTPPSGNPGASQSGMNSSIPGDELYTISAGAANRNYAQGLAGINNAENATGLDYGVDFTRNDQGGLGSYSIDPNVDVTNPFSKAALLKRSFQQAQRGNTNSYAARGQLYSGALQNAQNESAFGYQQGQDQLLKGFEGTFRDFFNQRYQAGQSKDTSLIDALGALLERQRNK